jgi:hypothetical protein
VREEVAKEYDDKYKASLEDIDQYKLQLERMLKDQEQRQAAIVSRSIAEKDKLIQQINGQKTELQNEITHLHAVIGEKEEIISDQTKAIEQLRAENARMAKKQQEQELKNEVVNEYMDRLKREADEYKHKAE